MKALSKRIYEKLRDILPDGVSIYPGVAKTDARYPFVVFSDADYTSEGTKDGIHTDNVNVDIVVLSDSYDATDGISDCIRSGFTGLRDGYVLSCTRTGGSSDYTDAFIRTINYVIRTNGNEFT